MSRDHTILPAIKKTTHASIHSLELAAILITPAVCYPRIRTIDPLRSIKLLPHALRLYMSHIIIHSCYC